jgi:cytochrome c-type biogenesis protein CcmH/NrfF
VTRWLAVLVAVAVVGASASQALAAGCPKTTLADLEDEVMCLACSVPLALADAPQAARERAFIAQLAARCESKQQIEAALVAQYGPRVLALPKASGFRLTAYLVPALVALLAAAGLAVAATRWRRRARASPRPLLASTPIDPAHAARIDAELERFRRRGR